MTAQTSKRISAGLMLALALLLVFTAVAARPAYAAASVVNNKCAMYHTVADGENIRRIANKYNRTIAQIAKANGLVAPYTLTEGDKLCIPTTDKPSNGSLSNKPVSLSVSVTTAKVTLTGSNFSKYDAYFVRIHENPYGAWYKIGSVAAKTDGTLTGSFKITGFDRGSVVTVCLKNIETNGTVCRQTIVQ